jgi:hypothetical protein
LSNKHVSASLDPAGASPAVMLRLLRINANGSARVEDTEDCGRLYQLFSELLPSQKRFSNMMESWGGINGALGTFGIPDQDDPFPANCSRQVCVQLLSSLLSQGKMLSLAMLPLRIEMEFADVNDAFAGATNDWIVTHPRLVADFCVLDQTLQNR